MDTSLSYEDPDLGPMISLRALMAAVRRNRRVWLATALLGLIAGASLQLVIPHRYSATADLYLAQQTGADPVRAMADNVALLQTQVVAKEAITAAHLQTSPNKLLSHYSGLPVSDTIMSIKFIGGSELDAVSGAADISQAFLAVRDRELRLQTDVLVRGLQSQISGLNATISSLNSSINFSPAHRPTRKRPISSPA